MKPGLLVIQQRLPQLLDALSKEYTVHDFGRAEDKDAFVADIGSDVRAVLTNGRGGLSADLIARLPNLEIICCFGVGYEMVNLDACRARGIVLSNAPGTNDVSVAEMALLLMLAVTRQLPAANDFAKADKWPHGSFDRTHTIGGKKLGIVGLGRIGRKIAERARAFDMDIGYHGPHEKGDVAWRYFPITWCWRTGRIIWSSPAPAAMPRGT